MKKQLSILFLSFSFAFISAMEDDIESKQLRTNENKLKSMIIGIPTLKFSAAWQIAHSADLVSIEQVGESELIDLIHRIKGLLTCKNCSSLQIKFFINIINNPDISSQTIKEYFLDLIESRAKSEEISKNEILDHMLLKAAEMNKLELAKLCIKEGANVNVKDRLGRTPLILAAALGSKEIINLLLSNYGDINICDDNGITPFSYAVYYSHKDIAQILINNNANIDQQNGHGCTALKYAVINENIELVQMLINSGADVNIKDNDGYSPLMDAMCDGFKEIAQMLINSGADTTAQNNLGETALKLAIARNNYEMAKILSPVSAILTTSASSASDSFCCLS